MASFRGRISSNVSGTTLIHTLLGIVSHFQTSSQSSPKSSLLMGFELHKPPEAWIKGLLESHWAHAVIRFPGRVFAVRFARIPLHSNLPEESGDSHYEKILNSRKKIPSQRQAVPAGSPKHEKTGTKSQSDLRSWPPSRSMSETVGTPGSTRRTFPPLPTIIVDGSFAEPISDTTYSTNFLALPSSLGNSL